MRPLNTGGEFDRDNVSVTVSYKKILVDGDIAVESIPPGAYESRREMLGESWKMLPRGAFWDL